MRERDNHHDGTGAKVRTVSPTVHVAWSNPTAGISFVGAASGVDSATLPVHATDDLILGFAYVDGSDTAPSLPSGWSSITSASGSGTLNAGRIARKVASSASETTGTWTNATSVVFLVYRGVDPSTPIGAFSTKGGTNNSFMYEALSMDVTTGTSWVVGVAGHREPGQSLDTPPSGLTLREEVVDATDQAVGVDTNGGVTAFARHEVTLSGTAGAWRSFTIEIRAAA